MTPLDQQAMRERHQLSRRWTDQCRCCHIQAPCDAIQALDALERAERVVKAARVLQRAVTQAQAEMPEGKWFGAAINEALAVLAGDLRAHDAIRAGATAGGEGRDG